MQDSFLTRLFTCILPQLLQRWWMLCVSVFVTPSASKEQSTGEGKADTDIDIEAGIRPCSEVMDISASAVRQTPLKAPDTPNTMEKSDLVSISLRSNTSIASISIDRTSANVPSTTSSLTVSTSIPARTPSIQIKVTKARTSEISSIPSTALPPHEIINLFHGKNGNRIEDEIHNEKTRNRVSSQRQSIVDPVKARIIDVALKQVQDRTVGVHKKVVITTPAIKITPSSALVEYCKAPLSYSIGDQDKSSHTLSANHESDGSTESTTSNDEEMTESIKSKRRGIRYVEPPVIFANLDTSHRKGGSMKIVPSIILESTQFPTPPASVSGSSIGSGQSSESIQDIISMFPVPPVQSPPSSPSDHKATHSLQDGGNKYTGAYARVTISPSTSDESSSNCTFDISISSEEGDDCSVSHSVTSEGEPPLIDAGGEPRTSKRLDAYYPPGISGKSTYEAGDGQSATPFLFPALPLTPPRPADTTHVRKQSNHLRPSSGEWLAKYSKLSPSSQSGRDSFASQLSVSVSVSVSKLTVFTEQYHDVVNTFNKAVEDNRRKGGAFHFNQDSLSAALSSSKERQYTSGADDGSSDEEKENSDADYSRMPTSDSRSTEDEDDHEEGRTLPKTNTAYKSSLRKRPDSLLWFAALDKVRAHEQAQQRASAWETDMGSDLSDEEYASTAALAVATPHQVEKPVSPLNVVKKSRRTSSSSDDETQSAESRCGSENSRESVSREDDAGQGILGQFDDEDAQEVSSDEMWFSSDSTDPPRRADNQNTASVTTLHTPELDANDIFARADESLDSTERSIDDILDMLDTRRSDNVKISSSGSPVDTEQHPRITFKPEQRNLGSVSFSGAPVGLHSLISGRSTESIGIHSVAPMGNNAKRRERTANGSPWRRRPPVAVDDEEDEEEDTVEECWGDLFAEAH